MHEHTLTLTIVLQFTQVEDTWRTDVGCKSRGGLSTRITRPEEKSRKTKR